MERGEQLIHQEPKEETVRLLGSYGLYDASLDSYEIKEHPEDERWIIRSEN